jgi:hypothetical protein
MWKKLIEEEVLDKVVEDGIFRVVGINEKDAMDRLILHPP